MTVTTCWHQSNLLLKPGLHYPVVVFFLTFFFLERYYWLYIAEYFFNATVDALYMPVFVYDFLDIQQH